MHAANIVYEFNGEFYSLIDARIKLNMRIWSKAQFDIYIYRLQATECYSLFPLYTYIHFTLVLRLKQLLYVMRQRTVTHIYKFLFYYIYRQREFLLIVRRKLYFFRNFLRLLIEYIY